VKVTLGVEATVYYLAVYTAMNVAAFAVVVARERETGLGDDLSALSGIGASDRNGIADNTFLDGMYRAGARGAMDAIGYHFYPGNHPLLGDFRDGLDRVRRTRERLPSDGCIESELPRSRLTGTVVTFASDTALASTANNRDLGRTALSTTCL